MTPISVIAPPITQHRQGAIKGRHTTSTTAIQKQSDMNRPLCQTERENPLTTSNPPQSIVLVTGMLTPLTSGRRSDRQKVQKILDWPIPSSVTESGAYIEFIIECSSMAFRLLLLLLL